MPNIILSSTIHLPDLITDLALILITASIAVLIFKRLKQPLVLGYLVAGFLAGKNFDFFPTVVKTTDVSVWAEIGVIFLLFSLGLEFSFKKLAKVGNTASITAITQIIAMLFIGYNVGQLMQWSAMNSIFLGVILSISSTTIILKAFDELGVKSQKFAGNVIGSLIVQDLMAILLMVLLSTIAVSSQFSGGELLFAILKLFFFLTLWFIVGIFFIPPFLQKAKNIMTDEMLLIVSIAMCLFMVVFAANVGFSPGLGAFVMGSILAETTQSEHIEKLIKPVKDLFGAIFFVSVGMLINLDTLVHHFVPVIILTFVTIFGQSISSTIGSLISGQPLKQSIQTGMSLSQIGEFSFIIATLGSSLKVTEDFLYPIVVAVSAITTFTTPYMIKYATPFALLVERKLPRSWTYKIAQYSANMQTLKPTNLWRSYINSYIRYIVINVVISIGIILLSRTLLLPFLERFEYGTYLTAIVTIIILLPFFWAISLRKIKADSISELIKERKYRGALIIMSIVRVLISLSILGFILNNFISPIFGIIMIIISIFIYIIFPKQINEIYHYFENRLLSNFNNEEDEVFTTTDKHHVLRQNINAWDGHIASFIIPENTTILGKTLEELRLREQFGINIAYIKRGDNTIYIPKKTERIYPNDEISIIGTDKQAKKFSEYININNIQQTDNKNIEIVLWKMDLIDDKYINKSIKYSNLREATNGIIVGIERDGNRILNPESNFILQANDVLWIVGDKRKIISIIE
ncbi:MAG: cation:proton antiporter [Chitinophagales bacterium]|nr:cation:proton antiporter [Chitinophagales bacterium]